MKSVTGEEQDKLNTQMRRNGHSGNHECEQT